ncbi:uncharacterized protein LOC142586082 [Dermacentor variabilis]|uniref:uncharacterized protein LOC142586082 n=1 Tax=Dermacentor variabilis TaxID=34621 RepID=UPI003F5CA4FA
MHSKHNDIFALNVYKSRHTASFAALLVKQAFRRAELGQPEFAVERSVLRSPFGSPYFRIRHRYKLFIFRSAQIMGSTVAAAELVVNDIVQFEGKLAAISEEPEDLPNPKKSFHLISLESLETAIPDVSIKKKKTLADICQSDKLRRPNERPLRAPATHAAELINPLRDSDPQTRVVV